MGGGCCTSLLYCSSTRNRPKWARIRSQCWRSSQGWSRPLRSARAVRYLRDLQTQLAPHRRLPAVRHFTGRVDATLGPRR
ncbi:hypothetical protein E1193_05390 [Micromonospora sp. KC606]|nr:hypothetical protein E1193_05390 [Micromonospora sp. KC606]